jgi:glyoxylase-like metal-dependent hydrolase (beta-lactamase superfamily II)
VNAYLLQGDPLTLVDGGPRTADALAALELALAARRLRVEDLELVVLTHHHVDHAGLAATIADRAGCPVAATIGVAELLADVEVSRRIYDRWATALLRLHGAPHAVLDSVGAISDTYAGLADSVEIRHVLEDGADLVAGDTSYSVIVRPGHSTTDTLFIDQHGRAIVGDHLLSSGPSVAMAEPPGTTDDPRERPAALIGYRSGLLQTAAAGLDLAVTGHGPPIDDVASIATLRIASQERRAGRILDNLSPEPRTAWELVTALRGPRVGGDVGHPISEAFIHFSDVIGHLDLLIVDGRARLTEGADGNTAFAAGSD